MEPAKPGDRIVARATETKRNFRTGFYRIEVIINGDAIESVAKQRQSRSSLSLPSLSLFFLIGLFFQFILDQPWAFRDHFLWGVRFDEML
jgi:hypothetical protein